jgi:hypothetical protein
MRKKRPHVASLDQVKITRDGEYAIIEYADADVSTTNFKIGPEVMEMSDQQILDLFNETLEAMDQLRREYEHVAVEIPIGQPQISYFEEGDQWTPRGARGGGCVSSSCRMMRSTNSRPSRFESRGTRSRYARSVCSHKTSWDRKNERENERH